MEINKMICEHCGKTFYSKHYTGGYIDHYVNFSSHKNNYGKDMFADIEKICFDGNNVRDDRDIQERLNCYLKWDNVSEKMKLSVKDKCSYLIKKNTESKRKRKKHSKQYVNARKKISY